VFCPELFLEKLLVLGLRKITVKVIAEAKPSVAAACIFAGFVWH
jgi:hypothetical protein